MKLQNITELQNLSKQIQEEVVSIQQQISKQCNYVELNYHQQLLKKAIALDKEWKQLIITNLVCAASAVIIGLCIWNFMAELGIFVAVPLILPTAIHFGWEALRLWLQGAPSNEFPDFRQKR